MTVCREIAEIDDSAPSGGFKFVTVHGADEKLCRSSFVRTAATRLRCSGRAYIMASDDIVPYKCASREFDHNVLDASPLACSACLSLQIRLLRFVWAANERDVRVAVHERRPFDHLN